LILWQDFYQKGLNLLIFIIKLPIKSIKNLDNSYTINNRGVFFMTRNIKILDRQFVPAGTLIIEQGSIGNRAFMVESGGVEVFIKDENGNEMILSELGTGAMVGEMAALSDGRRSASVRTKQDCVLISIPAHDLHSSMKASDSLYKRLISMIMARMKDTNMMLLHKEQQLADSEKASRLNLENVAAYLSSKQDKLQKQLIPILGQAKAAWEQFQPGDFRKD
jgi:CRP-like cAMP-binding protein